MPVSRRTFLAGTTASVSLVAFDSGPAFAAPSPASAVGMNRLVFQDDFTTLASIDRTRSGGAGFKWYLRAPWTQPSQNAGDLTVHNDGASFLRINPSVNNVNWTISTMDPRTGNGKAFTYGYFEARMRFTTPPEPNWASTYPYAWPSVWAITQADARSQGGKRTVELDLFEACAGPGKHVGVVHDIFNGGQYRWSSSNAIHDTGLDSRQWHTYAARVTANGAAWYVDNTWLMTQYWGSGGPNPKARYNYNPTTLPSPADLFTGFVNTPLVFALGSGIGAPFDIDWFRVWQR